MFHHARRRQSMIAAFLTPILFAVSALCGRRTARLLGGTEAHFWRLLFAALLLAGMAHLWGQGLEGTGLGWFVLSGGIGFGLGDVAFFQALPRIGSRLSTVLVLCLSAPMAAGMERIWLGTELTWAEVLSAGAILAGVAMALNPRENRHIDPKDLYPGMMFGLVAAFCQAAGAVLSRHAFALMQEAGEASDGMTAAYQRVLGGVLVTACCLLVVKRGDVRAILIGPRERPLPAQWARRRRWRKAWVWVLINGVAGPVLGVSCFQAALQSKATGIVLPVVALTPLVVMPLAYVFERERPSPRSLAGGAVAVLGAVLLAWAQGRGG